MDYPPLLDKQHYDDLIAQLVRIQPEDLVNVISRVLRDRDDVSFIENDPEMMHPNNSLESGQLVVPGCPGGRDCPESHGDHQAIFDRSFTIGLRGIEMFTTTVVQPTGSGQLINPDDYRITRVTQVNGDGTETVLRDDRA